MVGFPIVRHEAQHVALFRLLERNVLRLLMTDVIRDLLNLDRKVLGNFGVCYL